MLHHDKLQATIEDLEAQNEALKDALEQSTAWMMYAIGFKSGSSILTGNGIKEQTEINNKLLEKAETK